eukprot:5115123-Amphidinium_carterae.1
MKFCFRGNSRKAEEIRGRPRTFEEGRGPNSRKAEGSRGRPRKFEEIRGAPEKSIFNFLPILGGKF